jgi:hypothetical protein
MDPMLIQSTLYLVDTIVIPCWFDANSSFSKIIFDRCDGAFGLERDKMCRITGRVRKTGRNYFKINNVSKVETKEWSREGDGPLGP